MSNQKIQFLPFCKRTDVVWISVSFVSFHLELIFVYLELWEFDDYPHMYLSRTIKFPRLLKQFASPIFSIGVVTTLKVEIKQ